MRSIVPLAVVAVSLALASPSGAVSVGRFGGAQGCGCHGLEPSPSTTVTVESDGPVAAGSDATLTVRITDTAIAAHPDHHQGGFNLVVGEGSLTSLEADAVRAEGREAGHRQLGNRQREWRVAWRVPDLPSACALPVEAAALAANGDSSTTYDEWNRAAIEVPVAAGDDDELPELAFVKPASSTLTVGALGLTLPAPLTIHLGTPVEIAIRAGDRSGIERLELRDTDGGGTAPLDPPAFDPETGLFSLRWDTRGEPPGLHRLIAEASDCAGNGPVTAVLDILILL